MNKKSFLILAIALCICMLVGCANTNEKEQTATWMINFAMRDAELTGPLSEIDAAELEAMLASENWVGDTTSCAPDVYLTCSDGRSLTYHSGCGTFRDLDGTHRLELSDEECERFNMLLEGYGEFFSGKSVTEDLVLTKPPELLVTGMGETVTTAALGTVSWMYDIGVGEQSGFETDCAHPLDRKNITPSIVLTPVHFSSKLPLEIKLSFDPIPPDEIVVVCWNEECWGDLSAESTSMQIEKDGDGYRYFALDGGYIYSVRAEWNSYAKFSGSAEYSFFAAPVDVKQIWAEESPISIQDGSQSIIPYLKSAFLSGKTDGDVFAGKVNQLINTAMP